MRRSVVAGALSSGAGVALTAVSGWLIVRAAEMPPVLTLLVAIVGVRFFGMGRALLRWLERLTAHDAAIRLAAATRVRVWAALAAQGLAADRTPGSALARVGATELAGRTPDSLSPGELQKVAVARALVRIRRGARLLLLDEPTAHLDDDARTLVAEALLGLRGTVTVLLVSHDPLLAALADRTVDLPAPAPQGTFRAESPEPTTSFIAIKHE